MREQLDERVGGWVAHMLLFTAVFGIAIASIYVMAVVLAEGALTLFEVLEDVMNGLLG